MRDAESDPRFADSPLVTTEPHVRFYAGAPLVTPGGQAIGALCVMDRAPRELTAEQLAALRALSRRVVAQLELAPAIPRAGEGIRGTGIAPRQLLRQQLESLISEQRRNRPPPRPGPEIAARSPERARGREAGGPEPSRERGTLPELAENIHEVFWITDSPNHQIVYVSPSYEKIWGRKCEELYACPESWLDAIHPDDREAVVKATVTRQKEGTYDEEYRIVRADGAVRWIHDRAFPVANEKGEIARVVGVARDITQSKEADAALRESERRFREQAEMLDHAHDAIIVRDIHTRRITFWNQGAERLYGWTAAEAAGRDMGETDLRRSGGAGSV